MPFKEHALRLYMDKQMLARFQKYIGDKGLGRSYGGLKLLAIGLREEAYLTEGEFEAYAERYSVTLEAVSKPVSEPSRTMADVREKQRIEELARNFGNVLGQWVTMNDKARLFWVKKARENPKVQNAALILDLGDKVVFKNE